MCTRNPSAILVKSVLVLIFHWLCIYIFTYIYLHTYIYIHKYIHTYIHIYIYTRLYMYISHQHQNQYPIFSRFVFVSSLFPLYILYISHQITTLYTCHVLKMDCIPILRDSHQPLNKKLQIIKIRMGWMTITIIPCNLILTALIGTPRVSCSQDERKRLRDHT